MFKKDTNKDSSFGHITILVVYEPMLAAILNVIIPKDQRYCGIQDGAQRIKISNFALAF